MNKAEFYGKIYGKSFYAVCLETRGSLKKNLAITEYFLELFQANNAIVWNWLRQLTRSELKTLMTEEFRFMIPKLWFNFFIILFNDYQFEATIFSLITMKKLLLKKLNIATGTVYSVVPLLPKQLTKLTANLQKKLGHEVRLTTKLDRNLIAGIRVEVADRVFDNSWKRKLQKLRLILKNSSFSTNAEPGE